MNRIPARPTGKSAADLEKRVSVLTLLVVAQLVLLLVLVGMELFDDDTTLPNDGDIEQTSEVSDNSSNEPVVADMSEIEQGDEMPPEAIPTRPTRVEILNGCGTSGLASSYAQLLRDQGYDVRDTRNAPHHNYEKSWVIDRSAIPGIGHRLAATLGIDSAHVTFETNPQLVDVDLSLILGKDHQSLNLQP
jgi:hypothetical protein